tara:strand:- start:25105 stop:25521 length:417 start_codon:yes stop_codon:yes gene_type:complete
MQTKQYLGYLGLSPFLLTFAYEAFSIELFNTSAVQLFIYYSAIILSFIAGTLWRKHNDKRSIQLQLCSNAFSLLAFLTLLLPHYVALVALAKFYLLILLCEYHFDHAESETQNYLQMRLYLTTLVVLMHIIAFIVWCT